MPYVGDGDDVKVACPCCKEVFVVTSEMLFDCRPDIEKEVMQLFKGDSTLPETIRRWAKGTHKLEIVRYIRDANDVSLTVAMKFFQASIAGII